MLKNRNTSQILKKRARKNQKGFFALIFKLFIVFIIILLIAGCLTCTGIYFYIIKKLPKISGLTDYKPPIITTIYSDDNRKIAEFYKERRIIYPLSDISEILQKAFIAAEDARFYQHKGIDIISIIRAFIKNIEAGVIVQGGSTITITPEQ